MSSLSCKRKVHAFALGAVAERGVVDLDAGHRTSININLTLGLECCGNFFYVFGIAGGLRKFKPVFEGNRLRTLV